VGPATGLEGGRSKDRVRFQKEQDLLLFLSIQTDSQSRSLQYDVRFTFFGFPYSVRIREKAVKTYILE
jgi:hypothetical protein